jgi:hypothetical protein
MLRATTAMCVLVIVCSMVVGARADTLPLLKNSDTSVAIFSDDFESSMVGQLPASPWQGGLYGGGASSVLATCDLTSEGFAAYQGNKFAKLYRPDESGGVYLFGYDATGAANSTSDAHIVFQGAFRVDGNESSLYATTGPSGTPLAEFGLFGNGDVTIVTPDGQDWGMLTQKANAEQWNTLVITHTNGVDSFGVSVNGAAFEYRQGFAGMLGYAWDGICMQSDNRNSTGYWDAIPAPEPSSFVLLALGLTSLLAYAWRRQR